MHSVLFKTGSHMTVVYPQGEMVTIYSTENIWDEAVSLLGVKDYDSLKELRLRPVAKVLGYGNGRVSIRDGLVMLDNTPVENVLVDRMLEMMEMNLDIEPMALFLVNLYENPSFRAVNELYGFLEASDLTITGDGCFLAYKRVRSDYMDLYTGKMDNSIGEFPEMDRNLVDDDKDKTCSEGLHFCGRKYLSSYGTNSNGCRTVVVKVNPRDVVSIPSDYDNHKGRACMYEVVGELEHSNEAPLEGTVNFDYDDDYNEDWLPEDFEEDVDGTEFEDDDEDTVTANLNWRNFPSRAQARAYVSNNPSYVVRDAGPNVKPRWTVAFRKR